MYVIQYETNLQVIHPVMILVLEIKKPARIHKAASLYLTGILPLMLFHAKTKAQIVIIRCLIHKGFKVYSRSIML